MLRPLLRIKTGFPDLKATLYLPKGGHQTAAQEETRYRTKKIMSVKVDPLLRADRLPAERARDDRRRARLADAEVAAAKGHGPRVLEAHDALRPRVLGRRAARALDRAPSQQVGQELHGRVECRGRQAPRVEGP